VTAGEPHARFDPQGDLRAAILACLDTIVDPCSAATVEPMGLVSMGLIREVHLSPDGAVVVDLRLTSPACFMIAYLSTEADKRISALPGVASVRVVPDEGLDWTPANIDPAAARRRSNGLVLLRSRPDGSWT